jgi:uncharacterized protein YbjT (DUF2867 family)
MQAVIIGASGLVGSELLKKMLQDPVIEKIIAVGRKELPYSNPKLEQVLIPSLNELSFQKDALKGDIYFCCLGTTIKKAGNQDQFKKVDKQAVLEFAQIALAHNARSFLLVSAHGANVHSKIFYNRVKGETEEAIMSLNLNQLLIFRPALLIGQRQEKRSAEELAIRIFQSLESFLPKTFTARVGTKVDTLALKMLSDSKNSGQKIKITEAIELI